MNNDLPSLCRRNVRCYFFFFSSRRRHTRFDCDWSSDVCSSDLLAEHDEPARAPDGTRTARVLVRAAVPLPVLAASAEELQAHEAMLALITKVRDRKSVV